MASPVKQADFRRKPPPEATRWKPGQSGNPSGRPKKETLSEALNRIGDRPAPAKMVASLRRTFPGVEIANIKEVVLIRLFLTAARGSMKAVEILFDRLEGRAPENRAEPPDNRGIILHWIEDLKQAPKVVRER